MSVTTPAAMSAMIHETTMVNDVMKMRMLEGGLIVPAGSTVALKTGTMHVMLMGLKAPLRKGETIDIELVFERAGVVKVKVPVDGPSTE
jgi:periplasmic copper chaperone A